MPSNSNHDPRSSQTQAIQSARTEDNLPFLEQLRLVNAAPATPAANLAVLEIISSEFLRICKSIDTGKINCIDCEISVARENPGSGMGDLLSLYSDVESVHLQRATDKKIVRSPGDIVEAEIQQDASHATSKKEHTNENPFQAFLREVADEACQDPEFAKQIAGDMMRIMATPSDDLGHYRASSTKNSVYFVFNARKDLVTKSITSLKFSMEAGPNSDPCPDIFYEIDLIDPLVRIKSSEDLSVLSERTVNNADIQLLRTHASMLFAWCHSLMDS